jgi:hypothetical protein
MMRFCVWFEKSNRLNPSVKDVYPASFFKNSCSSSRYLNALRPSMKTTGTSSVNWRLSRSSVSTSTSRHRKPPRRSSFESFSFTISQRWHPLREYTITSRRMDIAASLANWELVFQQNSYSFGLLMHKRVIRPSSVAISRKTVQSCHGECQAFIRENRAGYGRS